MGVICSIMMILNQQFYIMLNQNLYVYGDN